MGGHLRSHRHTERVVSQQKAADRRFITRPHNAGQRRDLVDGFGHRARQKAPAVYDFDLPALFSLPDCVCLSGEALRRKEDVLLQESFGLFEVVGKRFCFAEAVSFSLVQLVMMGNAFLLER